MVQGENVYDVDPGDVYWAASDGPSCWSFYIVCAPLFHGCTTIMFEGLVAMPDAGEFWRVISEHKVKVMFTAPTAIRAIKREDPEGKLLAQYDLSHFKAQFLVYERCDPDTIKWTEEKLGVPVIDHWWQTETGWLLLQPVLVLMIRLTGSPTRSCRAVMGCAGAGYSRASRPCR